MSYIPGLTLAGSQLISINPITRVVDPRLVVWGDSITAGALAGSSSSPIQQQGAGFSQLAAVLAGNSVKLVHNAGVSGNTSTQILARFSTDVAPFNPDVVSLLAGTNDISSTSGITLAQSKANIVACVQAILSIGALPILGTIPPKGPSSTNGATEFTRELQLNNWLRSYCSRNNLILIDYYASLVNPASGSYQANYTMNFGGATGGTITFTVATQVIGGVRQPWAATNATVNTTTASLGFGATAAQVQTALNGATSGFALAFYVTGVAGGPYTITSNTGYPFDITVATNSLTGGTTPTVVINQAYTADETHPTDSQGQKIMANLLASTLTAQYPALPRNELAFLSSNNNGSIAGTYPVADTTNLMRNGCFTSFVNTAADFWTLNTTNFTYATVVPSTSDNLVGDWLSITTANSSGGFGVQQSSNTGWAVGDTLAFSGRIRSSSVEASTIPNPYVANTNKYNVVIEAFGPNTQWAPIQAWDYNITDGWFYQEMVVPTGTTSVGCYIFITGASGQNFLIGQWSVINITQSLILTP